MDEDEKMEYLLSLESLRLGNLHIEFIENLELFSDLKMLYL